MPPEKRSSSRFHPFRLTIITQLGGKLNYIFCIILYLQWTPKTNSSYIYSVHRPRNTTHSHIHAAVLHSSLTFLSHLLHLLCGCPLLIRKSVLQDFPFHFFVSCKHETHFACLPCKCGAGIISLFFSCGKIYRSCCDSLSYKQTECLTRGDYSLTQTSKARHPDAEPRKFGNLL